MYLRRLLYRLCKVPEKGGVSALTEECFQKTPLRFATDQSRIQYGWDTNEAMTIKAERTTVGTTPAGSEWTKNPIPLCNETHWGWLGSSGQGVRRLRR